MTAKKKPQKVVGLLARATAVAGGVFGFREFCTFDVDGGERAVMFHRFNVSQY
jgi:hypothetical protein